MIPALRFDFDPLLPWPLLVGLALLSVGLLVGYARAGGNGTLVRALGLLVVFGALLNPQAIEETREAAQDVATILVDQSESMTLAGRADAARAAADQLMDELRADPSLDVRLQEVRSGPDGTPLATAVQEAMADVPTERAAGVIVLTEGQAADIPNDPSGFDRFGPVHTLLVGDPDRGDRRLTLLAAPPVGIVGERITVRAQVDGPDAGAQAPVSVSVDGVRVETSTLVVGQPGTLSLTVPRRGRSMVVLEVARGSQEITEANNRVAFELQGVRDRLRVLLVTGEPYQGARVWRNLLKSDAAVDLVHFTILRPPEKQDFTPLDELSLITFPTYELFVEKLDRFDLIIFDRYRRADTLEPYYFDNIARRVEAGSALLIAAGPDDASPDSLFRTPLVGILPARPTGRLLTTPFRPALSELGRRHPVTRGLPNPGGWGRWSRTIEVSNPSGQTLMTGAEGRPLLVLSRAGSGRVALLLSDQSWLWARGYDGGGPYGELLRRTAHWLMQEPDLDDERLTLTATDAGLVLERTTMGPAPGPASLIDPSGRSQAVPLAEATPGIWRATVPAPAPGLYEARSDQTRAFATVGALNPKEAAALAATPDLMEPLAKASGGVVVETGEDGRRLPEVRRVEGRGRAGGETWIGLRRNEAYVVRAAQSRPLLPGWAWALMGLGVLMWGWRREAG